MRFDEADDRVGAALLASDQLLERGVGFADARRDAEIHAMATARTGACLAPHAVEHLVGGRSAIGPSHTRD